MLTVAQSIGLFSKLQRNRENRENRLKTNEYLTVKFNQSILFGRKKCCIVYFCCLFGA
jgi:hypothetical protein